MFLLSELQSSNQSWSFSNPSTKLPSLSQGSISQVFVTFSHDVQHCYQTSLPSTVSAVCSAVFLCCCFLSCWRKLKTVTGTGNYLMKLIQRSFSLTLKQLPKWPVLVGFYRRGKRLEKEIFPFLPHPHPSSDMNSKQLSLIKKASETYSSVSPELTLTSNIQTEETSAVRMYKN